MKALIIVDLQNDFVNGGTLAVPGGEEIIPLVNQLQEHFDFIVATQDWHPADHGSHACNHPNRNPGDIIDLAGRPQILWPAHCVQETHGADIVPGLNRHRWAAVFQKGTDQTIDSYSGFFDNGKAQATGLADYLKEHGITEVFVLGLATDYCVKFTALDAVGLNFKTHLVIDACRGVDLQAGDVQAAVQEMRVAGVRIVTAMEVMTGHLNRNKCPIARPGFAPRPAAFDTNIRPRTVVTPPFIGGDGIRVVRRLLAIRQLNQPT
jgi:nicotinamidase/pyrazinamidase